MNSTHAPLRILHLPVNVINQVSLVSRALREMGHRCDYLIYDVAQEDRYLHDTFDINLALGGKNYLARMRSIVRAIHDGVRSYDIFHFHSGRTFLPLMAFSRWSIVPNRIGRFLQFLDFLDVPYLKRMGKKLVFQFWGCDIRDPDFDLRHRDSACLICPPAIKKIQCNRGLKEKMNHITLRYGDARLSSGDLNACYKDFLWVENAIDTETWKPIPYEQIPPPFRLEKNGVTRIYHSFAKSDIRNDVKGTEPICRAVEELKQEGLNVELMFFNYLPHEDIRYYQMQADIVVDQLKCGHYGNTAVECLSMGKPVVSYLREEVEDLMPRNHPIVKADIRDIKEVLRRLVVDREYRNEMGRRSREFALSNHDCKVVAGRLEGIYRSLF